MVYRRFKLVTLSFIFTLLICITAIFYIPNYHLDSTKIFEVPKGKFASDIYIDLEKNHIVFSSRAFALYCFITGTEKDLRAGYYMFPEHASIYSVNRMLVNGIHPTGNITIIEGMNEIDVNKVINAAPYLGKTFLNKDDIGLLFPETYQYEYGEDSKIIIKRAKERMSDVLAQVWKERDPKLPIRKSRQLLILASILEKEVKTPDGMRLAASIIYNRLKIHMHLGIDATELYGLTRHKYYGEDGSIKSYDTYKKYGLPPSPISFPSIEALKAAASPDKTDYMYYITSDNAIIPAYTLKQHRKNINQYLK